MCAVPRAPQVSPRAFRPTLNALALLVPACRGSGAGEAQLNLRAIAHAAVNYFEQEHMSPTLLAAGSAAAIDHSFPPSAPMTPPQCCDPCAPGDPSWSAPTWQALRFEPQRATVLRYSFTSSGSGMSAQFVARAVRGCPTETDAWEVSGSVNADGNVVTQGPRRVR